MDKPSANEVDDENAILSAPSEHHVPTIRPRGFERGQSERIIIVPPERRVRKDSGARMAPSPPNRHREIPGTYGRTPPKPKPQTVPISPASQQPIQPSSQRTSQPSSQRTSQPSSQRSRMKEPIYSRRTITEQMDEILAEVPKAKPLTPTSNIEDEFVFIEADEEFEMVPSLWRDVEQVSMPPRTAPLDDGRSSYLSTGIRYVGDVATEAKQYFS